MIEYIIQTVAAVIGTAGFCLIFRVRLNRLPVILISAAACYLIYIAAFSAGASVFAATLLSSSVISLASELFAIWFKAPVTVFFISSILPLIPGAHLYYAMDAIFRNDIETALYRASLTLQTIGGIVLGLAIISAIFHCIRTASKRK